MYPEMALPTPCSAAKLPKPTTPSRINTRLAQLLLLSPYLLASISAQIEGPSSAHFHSISCPPTRPNEGPIAIPKRCQISPRKLQNFKHMGIKEMLNLKAALSELLHHTNSEDNGPSPSLEFSLFIKNQTTSSHFYVFIALFQFFFTLF